MGGGRCRSGAASTDRRSTAMPCYFFSGNQYIRVTRGNTGPGTVDAG